MTVDAAKPASNQEPRTKVLLVDDEPGIRRGFSLILARAGNHVTTAENGAEAIARIEAGSFDVIVSDIRMPGMNGIDLLRAIRGQDLDVPVVFLTGSPTMETAMKAMEYGAFRYLTKPVEAKDLEEVVARAAWTHDLARVRREAAEELDGKLVGDRAGLEAKFASALEKMWMAMQPILSWDARTVYAYEALLRTDEPTLRNPMDFLDAAERLDRTHELGRLVRQRVAEQVGDLPPDVKVFVNLHPSDLADETLCADDGALVPSAHRVVLEVTERATLDRVGGVASSVSRLRELGFRIALDDLGAGYAGLSSFAQLEPEVVKIDMSLVRGIHQSRTKQKLFRSFATLCKELDKELVAEGVETAEERDCLTELGGDLYQGYLFARPGRGFPRPAY